MSFHPFSCVLALLLALLAPLPGVAASGLVIYTIAEDAPAGLPPLLRLFEADGWRIAVNRVAPDFVHEHELGGALFRLTQQAHADGYDKVVLAGRSFGAWISLIANSSWSTPVEGGRVHALIALDASVSAENARIGRRWHDYKFMDVIKTQDPTRLAIILFDDDAEAGQMREDEIRSTIRRPAIPHLVARDASALAGPGGPDGEDFARRWGECLRRLVADAPPSPPSGWCRPSP
ncbi:MAG: hypothetical protein HY055_10120 [Magnetospirillum sp.]|nr:hypothetical protein [Magnetospirillum sp.]